MKPKKAKVGIITVNYNNFSDTKNCLRSLFQLGESTQNIIYVVDNGSTDGSAKKLSLIKNIKLIISRKNIGFAGGNNLAIKKALEDGCEYVLLINNDAELIDPLSVMKLIEKNKGVTAPIVSFVRSGEIIYDYGGKIDRVFGRNTHYESPFKIENAYPKGDYFSGVCLMVDKKVFEKTGLLDESFFLYYEDVDFCIRAKKAGFKLKLIPDVVINHKLSSSTNKLGAKKIKILANSHFNFCLKHLQPLATPFFIAFNIYLRLKTI